MELKLKYRRNKWIICKFSLLFLLNASCNIKSSNTNFEESKFVLIYEVISSINGKNNCVDIELYFNNGQYLLKSNEAKRYIFPNKAFRLNRTNDSICIFNDKSNSLTLFLSLKENQYFTTNFLRDIVENNNTNKMLLGKCNGISELNILGEKRDVFTFDLKSNFKHFQDSIKYKLVFMKDIPILVRWETIFYSENKTELQQVIKLKKYSKISY